MHNTSLLEILKTFTPEEIKKFDDFVNSPYHNKKSTVISLYKHIKKYAPEFQNPKLEKEKVWNALYKGKEFNYGVSKNLVYDLTHLAEKFISLECFQEEDFEMNYNLLNSLYKRQIKKLFLSKFDGINKNIKNLQKNKEISHENYSYILSKIYLLKAEFTLELDHQHPRRRDEVNQYTIFMISNFLYHFFNTGNEVLNFSKDYNNINENIIVSLLGKKEPSNFILELMESVKSKSIEAYNILNVYYKSYESARNNSSIEKYLDFKKALVSNATDFSKFDCYDLYVSLHNSYASLVSSEKNYCKEHLDIIKLMIRDGVMLRNGLIDASAFVSAIQYAFGLQDLKFMENFIERFIKYVPENLRENVQKYSLAHLYFSRNEFEKSLQEISTINYDIIHLKISLRNLQAMNYYELNNYNSFLLLFDSYRHFLSKDKSVPERFRDVGKLFINNVNKLFNLKKDFDEFEQKNFKNTILLREDYTQEWFLRKIEELENIKQRD